MMKKRTQMILKYKNIHYVYRKGEPWLRPYNEFVVRSYPYLIRLVNKKKKIDKFKKKRYNGSYDWPYFRGYSR